MRVLITGTSRGIGLRTAQRFLKAGHDVVGLDIRESAITHGAYEHWVCDIRQPMALPIVDPIHVLINNAGTQTASLVDEKDIGVNLLGTINCTRLYGLDPKIKAIVNIASASAHNGSEFPYYAASKGGVLAYTKWTAQRVAQWGATCNSISPGGVYTKSNKHIIESEELWHQVENETLLKGWATEEEIAEWVYFLAVHNTSMTGQDLLIDNGEMLKSNFVW